MKRLAIMGSGYGGNFQAIAEYFQRRNDIEITCLSNVEDAYILKRAEKSGVKYQYLPFRENIEYFSRNKFDLIALAGYMRILPEEMLKQADKIINIHPSLLPEFKGSTNAIKEAFESKVKESGITIHWVTSDVDGGEIIAQESISIDYTKTLEDFEAQMHKIEHSLYPKTIEKILFC